MRCEPFLLSTLALISVPQRSGAAESGSLWESSYVRVSGGGNWADELSAPSVTYKFDQGYRIDVAPGIQLGKHLGLEVEFGFISNEIKQRTTAAGTLDVEGDYWRVPMMINIIGLLPIKDFTLSGGVGFGGVYQDLSATGGGATFTDSRFDKAFQAMFGLQYKLTEVFSVGVNYKALVTLPEDGWVLFGPLPEKPDNHADHAVTAVFRFQF